MAAESQKKRGGRDTCFVARKEEACRFFWGGVGGLRNGGGGVSRKNWKISETRRGPS